MDDQKILDLFFARKEQAIEETDRKYGGYCFSLAIQLFFIIGCCINKITA